MIPDMTSLVRPLVWGGEAKEGQCVEVFGLRFLMCDPESWYDANGWYVLEETTNTVIEADGSPEGAAAAAQAHWATKASAIFDPTALAAMMAAAEQRGREAEREACAEAFESLWAYRTGSEVAAAIRARGQEEGGE